MFQQIKDKVSAQFDLMQASGMLLETDADRDEIWQVYLQAFPEATRQEHNCNCCKSFIRQIGGLVTYGTGYELITLWDVEDVHEEYAASVAALAAYVRTRAVTRPFYREFGRKDPHVVGTDKTPDPKRGVIWRHFTVNIQDKYAVGPDEAATKAGFERESKAVLERALTELSEDTITTVIDLVKQGSLYRGDESLSKLEHLRALKQGWEATPVELRSAFGWSSAVQQLGPSVSRIRNSSIGTLLIDIEKGLDIEDAVRAYAHVVDPGNYQRTTAPVTPRMVDKAKARLEELGLFSALHRRRLNSRDLTAADALYVHRARTEQKDVFAELAGEAQANPKTLSQVEEVHIDDFITNVLPGAKSLRVLYEGRLAGNMATLTGPQDPEAPSLFSWDNSFGWSYAGGVADAIKERVKSAGGRVDNCWMRMSLAWYNYDDLDLHMLSYPKGQQEEHVYFGNKRSRLAHLDIDMHVGHGTSRTPVENIYVERQLPEGRYEFATQNYARREEAETGFDMELEVGGETFSFSSPKSPKTTAFADKVSLTVDAAGNVTIADSKLAKTSRGGVKWGIKTGQWHRVSALTLSPNFWTKPTGNKHWFFLLEGCVSDEVTRPFYNEQLTPALHAERKTMEVLASKVEVAPAEGAELSGLGFSSTIRNHVFVEVEGTFKRVIKVTF